MKMLKVLLCALSVGLCYATSSCHDLQQSQLASLNERMTQMLSSLYTSPSTTNAYPPPAALPSSNATPSEYSYDTAYYPYPYGPPVIYVAPPAPYMPPKPLTPAPLARGPTPYYPPIPEYPGPPALTPTWSQYQDLYPSPPLPVPYPPIPSFISPPPPPPAPPISHPVAPVPLPYPTVPTKYPTFTYPTYSSPTPPTPYSPSYPSYPSWDSHPEYLKSMFPPPQSYYSPAYPPLYPNQPEIPAYYA